MLGKFLEQDSYNLCTFLYVLCFNQILIYHIEPLWLNDVSPMTDLIYFDSY